MTKNVTEIIKNNGYEGVVIFNEPDYANAFLGVTDDFWMDGSTGDLLLDGFDASNIYVNLTTGNVTGTILTSKYFSANSNTGYVDVPKTFEGGECEIIVNTGDIKINYKE